MATMAESSVTGGLGLPRDLLSDSELDVDALSRQSPEGLKEYADLKDEMPLNVNFPNWMIIAGLPKIGRDKYDRLRAILALKITTELTNKQILNPNEDPLLGDPFTIDMPIVPDPTKGEGQETTLGFCFVSFRDEFEATSASKCLSHVGLDSKHTFRVCLLDDFEAAISDSIYKPANLIGFRRENQRDWLNDPLGREQFIHRCRQDTYIMAHDAIERRPENVLPDQTRLGRSVCWSPRGSYLVSFQKMGIRLRADQDFAKQISFKHIEVKYVLMSPNEEYLITWDGSNTQVDHDRAVIVWQVLTGKLLRAFPTPRYSYTGVPIEEGGAWPFFLFSHDSKYLAMRRERDLIVYELPSMTVLEEPTSAAASSASAAASIASHPTGTTQRRAKRTPLNYPLEMFQWSPGANLLSLWIPENGDAPGRLLIVDIPSRQEIASKNVFSVKSVSIHWQSKGDFMALCTVIARKKGKKTKTETTQIEVFKVREKSVPVDTISVDGASIRNLFWEKGTTCTRFATLDLDDTTSVQSLKFYQVPTKSSKRDTELVSMLPVSNKINTLEWSPAGQYFVAASKGPDGMLLFGCLNEQNKVEILSTDDHPDLTDVMYCPSGRYVTTAVLVPSDSEPSHWRLGMSGGFRIYSFFGRLQYRFTHEQCHQFYWRPRPPSLLPPEKIEGVHRKLKEYFKKYDALDDARLLVKKQALKEESRMKMSEFLEKLKTARDLAQQHPLYSEWQASWKRFDSTMNWEESLVLEEEVIEVLRETVSKKTE